MHLPVRDIWKGISLTQWIGIWVEPLAVLSALDDVKESFDLFVHGEEEKCPDYEVMMKGKYVE